MSSSARSLFGLIVAERDVHFSFQALRTQGGSEPARWMLDQVFQSFIDPDGNFLQQFQSKGFDARFFELYLFGYLYYSRFQVTRAEPNPDFIVTRDGITAAVEATTVNPPTSGVLAKLGKKIADLSGPELAEYRRHELPMRFGSPLYSKLQKRYWELPHCRGLPFVLAIEAFHEEDALGLSDGALTNYLYGVDHAAQWDREGALTIDFDRIYSHVVGEKMIPSSFFDQPDTENISAVIFANTGTSAKFGRMGYQNGIGVETINMTRMGYCLNLERDARDPTLFSYNLDEPPHVETWGEGMVVIHNPNCRHPLPLTFFPDAAQTMLDEQRRPRTLTSVWHPFTSKTIIIDMGETKKQLAELLPPRIPGFFVYAITKTEFRGISGFLEPTFVLQEDGWFTDDSTSFLGIVTHDNTDDDWGFIVMARDEFFQFHAIDFGVSIESRDIARETLQKRIARLLSLPQRIFPRDSAGHKPSAADDGTKPQRKPRRRSKKAKTARKKKAKTATTKKTKTARKRKPAGRS